MWQGTVLVDEMDIFHTGYLLFCSVLHPNGKPSPCFVSCVIVTMPKILYFTYTRRVCMYVCMYVDTLVGRNE